MLRGGESLWAWCDGVPGRGTEVGRGGNGRGERRKREGRETIRGGGGEERRRRGRKEERKKGRGRREGKEGMRRGEEGETQDCLANQECSGSLVWQ